MKTLKDKLRTFWKDFREVIANLICIPFLLTAIVVVMLTVGVCKLTDTILQIDREEIGKSKDLYTDQQLKLSQIIQKIIVR